MFLGAIDITVDGHVMAGERLAYVPAMTLAAVIIWHCGGHSRRELAALVWTAAAFVAALVTAPLSFTQYSPGWAAHQIPVWAIHLGIAAQLHGWLATARKAQSADLKGVTILFWGAVCAAFVIFVVVQLTPRDSSCLAGLSLTCLDGPFVTAVLPAIITLALARLWMDPIARALRDRLGRP